MKKEKPVTHSQPLATFLENRKAILAIKDSSMLEATTSSSFDTNQLASSLELEVSRTESSRKRNQAQGKLLLVALLENYCMLYDQSKEQNQQLFFMLCQYLCRMGIIDSTDFLEEFTSVRASYKRAFKELVVKALQTVKEMEDVAKRERELIIETAEGLDQPLKALVPSPHLGARLRLPQLAPTIPVDITELLDTNQSRFEEDFEEICFLGRGAFGKVLQCRSKMDSRNYAIKIVRTDSSGGSELAKILREVKLLADIDHQNIVRYYGSWFQFTNPKNGCQSDSEAEEEDQSSSFSESLPQQPCSPSVIPASMHSYKSKGAASSIKSKPLTLFIQMELCQHTLKTYIEDLNREVSTFRRMEGKILYCFLDLLKGVQVIHEKNYIHRDIKPSNIYWKFTNANSNSKTTSSLFMASDADNMRAGCWKIGDFGLATWIQTNLEGEGIGQKQQQSYGVGTITYASPEQLLEEKHSLHSTGSSPLYSYETDIYSLGLILFELLYPFDTGMERIKVLTDLRLGVLPEDFVTELPKEAALILWMMSKDPASRPSIADILKLEWFSSPQQLEQQHRSSLHGHSDCSVDGGCIVSSTSLETEQLKRKSREVEEELRVARLRIHELELENRLLKDRLADH